MEGLSKKEKMELERIVKSGAIDVLQKIASTLLANWNRNPIVQETEFLTLKEAISRDERRKVLTIFLETIEKTAHD